MSIHISAQKGEIAKTVLLAGDPLRAKYIADNYLQDAKLVSQTRNAFYYTGTFNLDISNKFLAIASPCPRSSASNPG